MKIVLISREYEPFFGGGIGSYTERFARALASEGHHPIVVTVSADGLPLREERAGVVVLRLPFICASDWSAPHPRLDTPEHRAAFETFSPVSVFAMQIARALPGLIEAERPDVIEAPECGALAWFALNQRRAGRGLGLGLSAPANLEPPLITHLHSPTEWIEQWNRDPGLEGPGDHLRAMERDVARWADALVCPSLALGRWASETWRTPTPANIPYPLGPLEADARAVLRAPPTPSPSLRRLLFIGRLEARKGIDTLLAGFALAARRLPDLELHLVGRDTRDRRSGMLFGERACALLVPPDLRPRVVFRGSLNQDEVQRETRSADACVFPAPMDNFPFACVETIARGRLVLSTAVGGMGEVLRPDTDAILFEPHSPEACAAAIERAAALSPQSRADLASSGTRRILDLMSNRSVVHRRVEHFRAVIAGHRARRLPLPDPARVAIVADPLAEALSPVSRDRLARSISPSVAFAHGWVRSSDDKVRVFDTPDPDALRRTRAPLGPVALDRRLLDRPEVASLIEPAPDGAFFTRSTLDLARALADLGLPGAVIPDATTRLLEDVQP